MVHFILFILKIMVIILASILGILLLLILMVLLVPIRYQIYGEKREDMKLEGKVTWLLHLIYLRVTYESNKSIIKLRVFGKLFYDSQNVENKKSKIKKEKKQKVKDKSRKNQNKKDQNKKDQNKKDLYKKDKNIENENIKENKYNGIASNTEGNGFAEEVADNVIGKVNIENIHDVVDQVKETVTEKVKEELIEEPINMAMDDTKKKAYKKESDQSIVRLKDESFGEAKEEDENSLDSDECGETKKGLFYKFKTYLRKLWNIPKKIINLFIKIKNSVKKVFYIIIGFLEKWRKVRAFLRNETNKKGLKNTFLSLKKILKHIRPKKLKIDVEFGTGDPCSTGQLLGGLAAFYGYYGETVQIIPNFETAILEGSIFCKGRIRLFTLLIICIKLILNKEFRKLIENFKAFKEEL